MEGSHERESEENALLAAETAEAGRKKKMHSFHESAVCKLPRWTLCSQVGHGKSAANAPPPPPPSRLTVRLQSDSGARLPLRSRA